jgi:hypothetical protein
MTPDGALEVGMSSRQRVFVSWTTDVLIYIVVLNLYVEYSPNKVIDSFTISILTAALLKLLLDGIIWAKKRVWKLGRARGTRAGVILGGFGVWFIMFTSKFVLLEAVDFVFGEHVELGGFIDIILLVAGLMIARALFARVYEGLGDPVS